MKESRKRKTISKISIAKKKKHIHENKGDI